MKLKNLFALTILIFLQIVCIGLVASEKHKQLDRFPNQKARANAFPYKPFNAHQKAQGPHIPSFNYCELDLENFKEIIRINPNTKDVDDITPLYWACSTNNLEAIQSLLNNKQTKPNTMINGRTVLHIACEWGNVKMVELLLKNDKINPNKKTSWDTTALDIARNKGRAEIIKLLLSHPNIKENNDTAHPDSDGDETIEILPINEDITHQLAVAAKNTQKNWLRSKLHSLRKTITRNIKSLYSTCCESSTNRTQPFNEQKQYHNTASDNERSNILSKFILQFIVYPNLALAGIIATGCIITKYIR